MVNKKFKELLLKDNFLFGAVMNQRIFKHEGDKPVGSIFGTGSFSGVCESGPGREPERIRGCVRQETAGIDTAGEEKPGNGETVYEV